MLHRLSELIYDFIRRHVESRGHGGPVHRNELHGLGSAEQVDAALSVLLLDNRILAYQRSDAWVYTLPDDLRTRVGNLHGRQPFGGSLADLLRETGNDHILEEASRDERVVDALHAYFRKHPPRRTTPMSEAWYDGAVARTAGRSRWDVPRLDVVTDLSDGVTIRAR